MINKVATLFLLLFTGLPLIAVEWVYQCPPDNLMRDLMIVDYWNKRVYEKFPIYYNHIMQGGYFNMPSARMGAEGEIGVGYAHVPPYRNTNFRVQLMDRLEVSGSYRLFRGVDDPILSPYGFGDLSDKGANIKLAILHPEDSNYKMPGLAIGLEDFIGTKSFMARYIVLTQVIRDINFEFSIGYGTGRIDRIFAGCMWLPFKDTCLTYLDPFVVVVEYDPIPYKDPAFEKHPKGRVKKSSINWGFKYRLWNHIDFSLSRIRGDAWAWSFGAFYNFGNTKGLIPKLDDALPYKAPINLEPLGPLRPEEAMVQDFIYAMRDQGFTVWEIRLYYNECNEKTLRFKIDNYKYAVEREVRLRLNKLLAALVPNDIDRVIVVIEDYGIPIHQYSFYMPYVRSYGVDEICDYELRVLTPLQEVEFIKPYTTNLLYKDNYGCLNFELLPRTRNFFGSSRGKFKYSLGLNAGLNGFLPGDIYYSTLIGITFLSNLGDLSGIDRLNPSQLINVRTDVIRYYQQKGITLDTAYLQKSWNLGCGLFSRIALGYFEEAYGGLATECLYFPVNSPWAIGIEGAVLKKRTYKGIGFTDRIRKLKGYEVTHRRFLGSQYFLDVYYDWEQFGIDFKIKAGKFLANDWGARYEITRHFPSGLRITVWYTTTNGKDRINGHRYYDKGVAFSMPLDIFYTCSDRDRWYYGLSAWLRDVGVFSATGQELYNIIYEERNNH